MAHFALLNEQNVVINVVKVIDDVLLDENGNEVEQKGIDFLNSLDNKISNWKQTSYNNNIRNKYAVIGGSYLPEYDVFVPPQPFGYKNWIIDPNTFEWVAPVSKPNPPDEKHDYVWDDNNIEWKFIRITDPRPTQEPSSGHYWQLVGYEWVETEIPPEPTNPPEDGFVWEFNLISGRYDQVQIIT